MRGGWHGAHGTVGGLTRTYGLGDHFTREGLKGHRKISRDEVKRIARYFIPYWRRWLVILGCIGVAAGLNVLPPFAVKTIFDRAIPKSDGLLLGLMAGAMVALAMITGLIGVLQQSLTARVGQSIMFDLRQAMFRHLQRMSLRFYTSTRSGEIVSRINNDVQAVEGTVTGTLVTIAGNIATLTATSIAMLSMDWKLTLVAVTVVPAFYLPSRIVVGIRRRLAMRTQESQAALLAFLNERLHVGGSLLMNIFGQRQADASAFGDASARVRELHVRQTVVGRWLFMILSVFSAMGPALIYWYGGLQAMHGRLSTGGLIAFAALLTHLYRPLVQLVSVYVDIQASVAVFGRIFEYLDLQPDVRNGAEPVHLHQTTGRVRFENVGFVYPAPLSMLAPDVPEPNGGGDAEQFALRNVTFAINPGERVALVGPSGAGKTTITYLLPRFYDPSEGIITLDGHDLRRLELESLRGQVGMVMQETFLFHASVRENLLYARPHATDAEMIDACRAANIHDFIESLPERYDTIVGERGFRLSGGEKQRLSIARALLKDPDILILDEATSNLDATSEFLIQTALEKLLHGRTSLIIAHRLSTILNADRIVVMQDGQVEDSGRHDELLARGGLYARLFEQQFRKVLEMRKG